MFSSQVLKIDIAAEAARISDAVRAMVLGDLSRRGAIVGLSGGVDSSVVAALCVRALGEDKVFGLVMPERDSSTDSLELGRLAADAIGIQTELEDITPALEGAGCYRRQDEA